jgi:F-type H+-transporting ATPase subunit b
MMKNLKKIMTLIPAAVPLFLFSTAAAFASEAAEGGHEEITFLADWLPRLVNFAIIAGIVIYFTRKPIRDFFRNRSLEIAKAMQESKESRERAVAALSEMERKVKDLEVETNRLIEDAKARGEKDKQALIEEGRKIVEDIHAQVKEGVEVEVEKARTTLQVEASLLSIDLAEGRIKEKIDSSDHERIVKEYITKVGGK